MSRTGLTRLGEQGWATAHDLITDVVAQGMPPADRGRLHSTLARALEAAGSEAGELARHWTGAGDPQRATAAYLVAATRAVENFADAEATAFADAGLDLAPSPATRAALFEARARARGRLGDLGGARDDPRQALRHNARGPTRARLLGRLASLASGAEDLVRAAELAELAVLEAGDDSVERAHALEIAAVLDMNLDRAGRADTRAAEALELYQRMGDANGAARILDSRAMATFLAGKITDGTNLLERAANLFEDSGDLVHVITPRSTAGHGLVFADQASRGLATSTTALNTALTLGHPEGQTYALWHCAEALAALGRGDQALAAATEALDTATRIGHRGWTATAWRAIGIAHQALGDPGRTLTAFNKSVEVSEHLNLFASWAAARCALVLGELGELSRAEPLVQRALNQDLPLATSRPALPSESPRRVRRLRFDRNYATALALRLP